MIVLLKAHYSQGYEQCFARFEKPVHAIALDIVKDDDDAFDVTVTVMMKVYFGIAAFHGQCTLNTWVMKLATNCSLDFIRNRKCKKNMPDSLHSDEEGYQEKEAAEDNNPETEYMQHELEDAMQLGLSKLKDADQKKAIELRYMDGLSYSQIAKEMHKTVASVKGLVFKGKLHLHKILYAYWKEYKKD